MSAAAPTTIVTSTVTGFVYAQDCKDGVAVFTPVERGAVRVRIDFRACPTFWAEAVLETKSPSEFAVRVTGGRMSDEGISDAIRPYTKWIVLQQATYPDGSVHVTFRAPTRAEYVSFRVPAAIVATLAAAAE